MYARVRNLKPRRQEALRIPSGREFQKETAIFINELVRYTDFAGWPSMLSLPLRALDFRWKRGNVWCLYAGSIFPFNLKKYVKTCHLIISSTPIVEVEILKDDALLYLLLNIAALRAQFSCRSNVVILEFDKPVSKTAGYWKWLSTKALATRSLVSFGRESRMQYIVFMAVAVFLSNSLTCISKERWLSMRTPKYFAYVLWSIILLSTISETSLAVRSWCGLRTIINSVLITLMFNCVV